jgi:hypothetical protein
VDRLSIAVNGIEKDTADFDDIFAESYTTIKYCIEKIQI